MTKPEQFLQDYLNTASPAGFEQAGQMVWLNYLKHYVDETFSDTYGTAVGVINPEAAYKVVIEGHADEISWFVNYIADDGIISVIRNGGSDHQIAPSKTVNIHTEKKGIVKGVFGWPAIHTRMTGGKTEGEKTPSVKNIFIDIGARTKAEAEEMGVQVGDVITYPDELFILAGKHYVCRALDNRIGGYMIAEVARRIKENDVKLPFGLYIVNSVQEEVGLNGASMIANTIRPNVAIITDVTHDNSTPMMDKKTDGDIACGSGAVISRAPAVHNKLRQIILDTAREKKIPYQLAASSRSTGTDTDAFAYSGSGIASALISLPLRYMHTTVEMVDKKDVESVIELIYNTLLELDPKEDFKYIRL